MVIFLDSVAFLNSVQEKLVWIVVESTKGDQLRIKSVVSAWRESLASAHRRLVSLHDSISELMDLIGAGKTTQEYKRLSAYLLTRIKDTTNRVERAQWTIRQELSILGSQQQLEEAASITKLTELAFIFTPLSFVTSAFSMQIKELEKPVPLSIVVATGIIALSLAYATRLVLRSSITINLFRSVQNRMRRFAKVPTNTPTPTRAFLQTALFLLHQATMSAFAISVLCMAMVVSLWATRISLDSSFKSFVTVFVTRKCKSDIANACALASPYICDTPPSLARRIRVEVHIGSHILRSLCPHSGAVNPVLVGYSYYSNS